MKIRHPLLIKGVGILGAHAVSKLVGTCRFHFDFADPTLDPAVARQTGQRYIYAFFHEIMLFPAYYWPWPEMHILIGEHADGEMITQVTKRLGFSVVRGSTTRGGAKAVRGMLQDVKTGHLCFTPDGPRGPRRHVHQGMIYVASRLGLPIVAVGMAFSRAWRAKSWDRFAVPRPGSSAACVIPQAVHVPPDADRETLEDYRARVERVMNESTSLAEQWVAEIERGAARSAQPPRGVPAPHLEANTARSTLENRK